MESNASPKMVVHVNPGRRSSAFLQSSRLMNLVRIAIVVIGSLTLSSCTTGKVIATPFTVVRDTVDLPVMSVTNFFAYVARSSGGPSAYAGPSWSLRGGFDFGIGLNLASFVFWTFSGITGGADYIVCRSLYPDFPTGISPWKKRGAPFGPMVFPNTRALWNEGKDKKEQPQPGTPSPQNPNSTM